jgi:hypothetical protein
LGAEENIGPRRDEVTGECRKQQNEELNDLHSSANIIGMIKSGRVDGQSM